MKIALLSANLREAFGEALFAAFTVGVLIFGLPEISHIVHAAEVKQATYKTQQEAVEALVAAVRAENPSAAIVDVLGPEGEEIAASGDPVADEIRRTRFLEAFQQKHSVQPADPTTAVLIVGQDEFPFPVPLVTANGKWRWDTPKGLEEVLNRRIGENELATIEVMRGYVAAQLEYADEERDGKGIQYARRLVSSKGRKDGLYWPVEEGESPSPIGPLIAEAQSKGYSGAGTRAAYNGYVFRMLYGQGANAADGARDYIVNDRMIGGFALIARPAEYDNSGVMTFIVNNDGVVYEKDLGPDTEKAAATIKLFDPDPSWKKIEQE